MPGVDKSCEGPGATHHLACSCREAHFAELERKVEEFREILRQTWTSWNLFELRNKFEELFPGKGGKG